MALGGTELAGELVEAIDRRLQTPWYLFERSYLRGRMDHIAHYDQYGRLPEVMGAVQEAVAEQGYDPAELGQLIVPVYYGGSAYCESDLYYAPSDASEAGQAGEARMAAYRRVLEMGSFADRPTGEVADMVYAATDPGYLQVLRTFKNIVDPQGILNPGQLLEGV
jgi:FAD/FMN-containing dehydrogenase